MNENVIEIAWNKADIVESYDKDKWRKDFAGAWIQRNQYGLRSEYGWMIDHVVPRSKGGSDEPSNRLPVHWRNNIIRADRYPVFKSGVTSDGENNIDKEQSWKITK